MDDVVEGADLRGMSVGRVLQTGGGGIGCCGEVGDDEWNSCEWWVLLLLFVDATNEVLVVVDIIGKNLYETSS